MVSGVWRTMGFLPGIISSSNEFGLPNQCRPQQRIADYNFLGRHRKRSTDVHFVIVNLAYHFLETSICLWKSSSLLRGRRLLSSSLSSFNSTSNSIDGSGLPTFQRDTNGIPQQAISSPSRHSCSQFLTESWFLKRNDIVLQRFSRA